MESTRVRMHMNAPPAAVYTALTDPDAVARWRVPDGMSIRIHAYEVRVGGSFRITLTYEGEGKGKTSDRTDTYHGRFVELHPHHKIVEVVEFETADPSLQGESTITYDLIPAGGGTDLVAIHDHLPPGLSPADNEQGWRSSLARLEALVEP